MFFCSFPLILIENVSEKLNFDLRKLNVLENQDNLVVLKQGKPLRGPSAGPLLGPKTRRVFISSWFAKRDSGPSDSAKTPVNMHGGFPGFVIAEEATVVDKELLQRAEAVYDARGKQRGLDKKAEERRPEWQPGNGGKRPYFPKPDWDSYRKRPWWGDRENDHNGQGRAVLRPNDSSSDAHGSGGHEKRPRRRL